MLAYEPIIVMEWMKLGSLHDVLHNELIPDIPSALRIKILRQAAKGMYFLHSSGIVHRDLKSLNLLLDSKWNVKVSDFGLTRFKETVKKGTDQRVAGSIHWTAPEVLNEVDTIDYMAADMYSFGMILGFSMLLDMNDLSKFVTGRHCPMGSSHSQ